MRKTKKKQAEQRRLNTLVLSAGLRGLGIDPKKRQDILNHYTWWLSIQSINKQVQTDRTAKCLSVARELYHVALSKGILELTPQPGLPEWTKAGRAMQRAMRQYERE